MTEQTISRVGIFASIIGAIGALAYLARGSDGGKTGPPGPAATGAPNLFGAGGSFAIPTAPPNAPTARGNITANNSVAGSIYGGTVVNFDTRNQTTFGNGASPSLDSLTQFFTSQFYPAVDTPEVSALSANAPIGHDLAKQYVGAGLDTGESNGCGCGGSCGGGCGGGLCPVTPPYRFTDGAKGCLTTQLATAVATTRKCYPHAAKRELQAAERNLQFYGYSAVA